MMNPQNYQQPPFQPTQHNTNRTTLGMDGNVAALLSYLVGIVAIVVLIAEKENRFARFHALQAILFHSLFAVIFFLLFILLFILGFVFAIIGAALGEAGAIVGMLASVVIMLLWIALCLIAPLAIVGGNIYGAVQSYHGKWFKFPIVGKLSAKILGIAV